MREPGRAPFDDADVALLGRLSPRLGAAVRDHAHPAAAPGVAMDGGGPGMLLFSPAGELVSADADALAWLEELTPLDGCAEVAGDAAGDGIRLPLVAASTLMRARAIAEERDPGPARARIRSRSGRWLACHASCMRTADGAPGGIALVIEPAAAAEIAPILAHAYGLTSREQQITALIARGVGTAEIASRLHLSAHTVRDHVKAIFGKAGVSSRGELVARLFAEHYAPLHA